MARDKRNFAVFILTHGRPDNVITARTLRKAGYSGRIYYIIDNEDKRGDEYRERFGEDNVIEFNKLEISKTFDTADTQEDRRTIIYARNASFPIAKALGLDYFWQLDDDYTSWMFRHIKGKKLSYTPITDMDSVIDAMLDLLESTNAVTVAISQGGDHIGGASGSFQKGIMRKAMNSFFFRTDRPVTFVGRINEDVNTYVLQGSRGDLFLTVTKLQLTQMQTQQNAGGMTDIYLKSGTYVKSFYTVMMHPSSVQVRTMGQTSHRMHHAIKWDMTVPKIINEKYRKPRD